MDGVGAVFLGIAMAGGVLGALFLLPSLVYARTVRRLLQRSSARDHAEGGPLVWLEAVPFLDLYWRFRNLGLIRAALEQLGKTQESAEQVRKERLGWSWAVVRVVLFVALAVVLWRSVVESSMGDDYVSDLAVWSGAVVFLLLPTDVVLWGIYWRRLSRVGQGRPLVDRGSAVSLTVGAKPETVLMACREWAKDARWDWVGEVGEALLFGIHPFGDMGRDKAVSVEAKAVPGGSEVTFRGEWGGRIRKVEIEEELARSFARGACWHLAGQGLAISGTARRMEPSERDRAMRIARWRWVPLGVLLFVQVWFFAGGVVMLVTGAEWFWGVWITCVFAAMGLYGLTQTIRDGSLGLAVRWRVAFWSVVVVAIVGVAAAISLLG